MRQIIGTQSLHTFLLPNNGTKVMVSTLFMTIVFKDTMLLKDVTNATYGPLLGLKSLY